VQVWFEGANGAARRIEADEILVAAKRVPNTKDIGLETVSLKPGDWIDVDDACQVKAVTGGRLYAAGDVNWVAGMWDLVS
jgi:pyruvate/2-oxoglutarate dehydrogenase complex dihydrolipoamide dehydrogenase (E3) component